MSKACTINKMMNRKKRHKPTCGACPNYADFEVVFDNGDHYLMMRYCQKCFSEAGYKAP